MSVNEKEKLLTAEQVADILNYTVQGIYQLVHKKRIPVIKLSEKRGPIRFRRTDIEAWLASKTQDVVSNKEQNQRQQSVRYRSQRRGRATVDYVDNIIDAAKREVLS
ncbi:MAG: helix-turn-helix domain-containing protein [Nitrospirota bacterium]